jgi:flagellar basal body-associated protein FliL
MQEQPMDKSTLMAVIIASILVIVNAAAIAQFYPTRGGRPSDDPNRRDDSAAEPRDVS